MALFISMKQNQLDIYYFHVVDNKVYSATQCESLPRLTLENNKR